MIPLRKMFHIRNLFWGPAILIVLYFVIVYNRNYQIDDKDRKSRLLKINELIKSSVDSDSELCTFPEVPVNSSEMMKFIRNEAPIDCSSAEEDWVIVEGSVCKLTDAAKRKYISVTCIYTDLIRVNDLHSKDGRRTTITDDSYTLKESDVVRVVCNSNTVKKSWKSILTGIRENGAKNSNLKYSNLPADALNLNVLMFGFDSLSKNTFIRKLPKTYKYLTDVLDAQVLQGYNIVGDGTPQALIPILTGQTELELPDTRKRIPGSAPVDVYPFIWKDFEEHGYVTGFLEDLPDVSTFTYRLNGFKERPTHHYMRPYYLASSPELSRSPRLCYGSTPRHKIMMDYVKNFFTVYKNERKFMFAFHGELSHDSYNLIGVIDDDLLEFVKDLKENGYLEDTILIMMSDHGHRFAEIRDTIEGKQEERLPFFSFTFPPNFKIKHKVAFNNFVQNKAVLTTPFDIYVTLKSVLHLGNTGPANLEERALSLFSQIPKRRNCNDAYIEPHWCSCLVWQKIPSNSPIVPNLITTLLNTINKFTEPYRAICERLSLKKLVWATKVAPNDYLVKFKRNADIDGFVADLSSKMELVNHLYQIKVQLEPGDSVFEASISHNVKSDQFYLKLSDVSRINMYRKQARCVETDYPHLRKYCYCKDSL